MSLLFVILGLVALFTDNRVLMLVAALFLGLSILLTIGLLVHTGFNQKPSDE
jgi:disulfide bond formation protein DsbB|tara:strand:- start:367 stop:522 length:156 start_codon:yes stop_codon:yes gene_type:complete